MIELQKQTDKAAMDKVFRLAEHFDDRSISDAARLWANTDVDVVGFPESLGELRGILEVAFDAGRLYQMMIEKKHRDKEFSKNAELRCELCASSDHPGFIRYYYDAGDHFGAGRSPSSEWRYEPCPGCGKEVKPCW